MKKYIFPNNKIGYDEYLRIMEEFVKEPAPLCSKMQLEVGVEALTKIDDPNKRQKLIDASILVDQMLPRRYKMMDDTLPKQPSILAIANMIANHYDLISDLDIEQLAVLGYFSYVVEPSYMEKHLKLFGDKRLLDVVMEKTEDNKERYKLLELVEDKCIEFAIDKCDERDFNLFKIESIMAIKCNSKESLFGMLRSEEEVMQDLRKLGF